MFYKKYPIADYCYYNNMSLEEYKILDGAINYPHGHYKTVFEIFRAIEELQKEFEEKYKQLPSSDITADSIPKHYTQNKNNSEIPDVFSEPVKFFTYFKLDGNQSNVLKYMSRYKQKNGVKDLEKVKFYSDVILNGNYETYEKYKLERESK